MHGISLTQGTMRLLRQSFGRFRLIGTGALGFSGCRLGRCERALTPGLGQVRCNYLVLGWLE